MNTSFAVMAHPKRQARALALSDQLDRAPVAWAQRPYATKDDWGPVWDTRRAALLMHTDAPFHCIVQDDVTLTRDFRRKVEALTDHGDHLYMLFFRKKRNWPKANELANGRTDFVISDGPLLGPGLVFPVAWIPELVEACDAMERTYGDDDRMRRWLRSTGKTIYVPIPSLVEHDRSGSLIGNNDYRTAWRFRR